MYNLRSSQRKEKIIADGCYLQNYLKHAPPNTLNPKVRLERLKFLDDNDIQNSRFYCKKDKIIIKQGTPKVSNKAYFLIGFFFIILFVLCLFFYEDKMQFYSINVMKKFSELCPSIKSYYFQTIKLYKNFMRLLPHTELEVSFQTIKSDKAAFKKDLVVKSRRDDFEVRKLVRDNFKELENLIKFENITKTSRSFIEEQCEIGVKDNLTWFDDSNLMDYALESLGAEIVTVFDTVPYGPKGIKFLNINLWSPLDILLMKYSKYFNTNGPNSILVPWRKPGDCWAFKGSHGRVQIKLSEKIFITAITIDHIPKEYILGRNIESAPKKFSVLGVLEPGSRDAKKYLGTFEYSITGLSSQTFFLQPELKTPFRWIEVDIESNHGKNYTCVYKIRVHGHN